MVKIILKKVNIEIDLDLVQQIMETYNLKSIDEAVNFSLKKSSINKKGRTYLLWKERFDGKVTLMK